jgi:hypothetical protein
MADTIVTMTSPEGATLNTAGTYCEGDIEVIPKLQEKTATTGEVVTPDAGYAGLKSVDTTPVFEAGKKSEYDAFWDCYQNRGARTDYAKAFGATGLTGAWTDDLFMPKYDLICTDSVKQMFLRCECKNIKQTLESAGVVLDTSNTTGLFTQMFQYCKTEEIPFIDMSKATNTGWAFGLCSNLISLHIKVSETTPFVSLLAHSGSVKSLTVEGTIGQNGFDTSYSPLNKASLTSIVNALSSTTTGLTVTLRLSAVNTAFETSAGAADGSTSEEWTALIATKPNWTINLINS